MPTQLWKLCVKAMCRRAYLSGMPSPSTFPQLPFFVDHTTPQRHNNRSKWSICAVRYSVRSLRGSIYVSIYVNKLKLLCIHNDSTIQRLHAWNNWADERRSIQRSNTLKCLAHLLGGSVMCAHVEKSMQKCHFVRSIRYIFSDHEWWTACVAVCRCWTTP